MTYVISEEQLCRWEKDIDIIEGEFGCSGDPPNENLSIISHIRSHPLSEELKKERERILKELEQTAQHNWEEIETDEGEMIRMVCLGELLAKIEDLRGIPDD